jgi:hypothetical protein
MVLEHHIFSRLTSGEYQPLGRPTIEVIHFIQGEKISLEIKEGFLIYEFEEGKNDLYDGRIVSTSSEFLSIRNNSKLVLPKQYSSEKKRYINVPNWDILDENIQIKSIIPRVIREKVMFSSQWYKLKDERALVRELEELSNDFDSHYTSNTD